MQGKTMWPFDQPQNCATLVSKSILAGRAPILLVCHDEDDHGWQFLDGVSEDIEDIAIVGLAHILDLDSTMADHANLPPGYQASRKSEMSEWVIEKTPFDPDDDL